jgi:hypothetical protein
LLLLALSIGHFGLLQTIGAGSGTIDRQNKRFCMRKPTADLIHTSIFQPVCLYINSGSKVFLS